MKRIAFLQDIVVAASEGSSQEQMRRGYHNCLALFGGGLVAGLSAGENELLAMSRASLSMMYGTSWRTRFKPHLVRLDRLLPSNLAGAREEMRELWKLLEPTQANGTGEP